jgi:hypothetical protein
MFLSRRRYILKLLQLGTQAKLAYGRYGLLQVWAAYVSQTPGVLA